MFVHSSFSILGRLTMSLLTLDHMCKGTQWYSIGRARGPENTTDIHIDDQNSAVSGYHLQLGFDENCQVVLKNTSSYDSYMTYKQVRKHVAGISTQIEDTPPTPRRSEGDKKKPPIWVVPVG